MASDISVISKCKGCSHDKNHLVLQHVPQSPPSDNFLGAIKFVIANVKYYTKYVKSSLSTNSKIVVILVFLYSYSVKQ